MLSTSSTHDDIVKLRAPADFKAALAAAAYARGISMSEFVRQHLRIAVAQAEGERRREARA